MTDDTKLKDQIKYLEKYRRAVHRIVTNAPSGIDDAILMAFCYDVEALLLAKRAESIERAKAELNWPPK